MIEGRAWAVFNASAGGPLSDEVWYESVQDIIDFRAEARRVLIEAARQEEAILRAAARRHRGPGAPTLTEDEIAAMDAGNQRVEEARQRAEDARDRFKRGERPPKRERKPRPKPPRPGRKGRR